MVGLLVGNLILEIFFNQNTKYDVKFSELWLHENGTMKSATTQGNDIQFHTVKAFLLKFFKMDRLKTLSNMRDKTKTKAKKIYYRNTVLLLHTFYYIQPLK